MPELGLTREEVREFQQLLREESGDEQPLDAAWARAAQLVTLYRMLVRPIPEDSEVQTSAPLPSPPVDC